MEWTDGGGEWGSDGEGEREGGVRERGGVKEGRGVREREGSEVDSWFVGAHCLCACMGHGCALVMGAPWSWAHISWGHVSVVGGIVVACEHLSCMSGGLSCPCALVICGGGLLSFVQDGRPWVAGRGVVLVPGCCRLGVICGCWVLLVGGGCPLWVLGVVRGRWVVCKLWVVGGLLLGMMSLLGVGSLLAVRSLLRAVMSLGLSWYECGGMDIPTYCDVGAK